MPHQCLTVAALVAAPSMHGHDLYTRTIVDTEAIILGLQSNERSSKTCLQGVFWVCTPTQCSQVPHGLFVCQLLLPRHTVFNPVAAAPTLVVRVLGWLAILGWCCALGGRHKQRAVATTTTDIGCHHTNTHPYARFSPKISCRLTVFVVGWKISSGSTLDCPRSCSTTLRPRAQSGMGLLAR